MRLLSVTAVVVFNLLLAIFFGWLHQAGVIQSSVVLGKALRNRGAADIFASKPAWLDGALSTTAWAWDQDSAIAFSITCNDSALTARQAAATAPAPIVYVGTYMVQRALLLQQGSHSTARLGISYGPTLPAPWCVNTNAQQVRVTASSKHVMYEMGSEADAASISQLMNDMKRQSPGARSMVLVYAPASYETAVQPLLHHLQVAVGPAQVSQVATLAPHFSTDIGMKITDPATWRLQIASVCFPHDIR
jgi:hypothetical protein